MMEMRPGVVRLAAVAIVRTLARMAFQPQDA